MEETIARPELLSLPKADQLVRNKINEADEQMIFGFLPLSISEQNGVIEAVKSALKTQVSIYGLLRAMPAATGYALAVAPARNLNHGRRFWEPFENSLGLAIPLNRRNELSALFQSICENLGLLSGILENAGWGIAAPFIYQAGIFPSWVDTLSNALQSTLRNHPTPDLEDPTALRKFSNIVCTRTHGMANLRHLLASEVGPLLVQRIVTASQQNNWSVLPAHFEEAIKTAFINTGAVSLRSPYLSFDPAFQQLQLVLPAVSSSLTTFASRWKIEEREHAAAKETRIPIEELPGQSWNVELTGLANPYETITFFIDARFSAETPFRLFRGDNGRERKVSLTANIQLPPNSYTIVMEKSITTNDEDYVENHPNFRRLDFELRPGDAPLFLSTAEKQWSLTPRLKSGFYVDREIAATTILENGELLHYGNNLGLIGYIPASTNNGDHTLYFEIECPKLNLHSTFEPDISDHATEEIYLFQSEAIKEKTTPFLNQLPPGIHQLKTILHNGSERAEYSFWYWKGLHLISHHLGFQCSEWPENLHLPNSTGIERNGNNVTIFKNYHAPSVTLSLIPGDTKLSFPRAGVRAIIIDPTNSLEEIIQPFESIIVTANDQRSIRFESGGFTKWQIKTPGRNITILDKRRTSHAFSLAGLSAEIGGSGTIRAISETDEIRLLTLTKPLAASTPYQNPKYPDQWSFTITLETNDSLGVSTTDLSTAPNLSQPEISPIISWNENKLLLDEVRIGAGSIIIQAVPHEKTTPNLRTFYVNTSCDPKLLENELWLIEFHHRSNPESEWSSLLCKEPYDYSSLALFAWGRNTKDPNATWWQHLRDADRDDLVENKETETNRILSRITDSELENALKNCRQLFSRKYPSSIWYDHASQIRYLPIHLGHNRFNTFDNSGPIWWHQATLDLAEHAAIKSPAILKQFLFAAQPAALRLPPESTTIPCSDHQDMITASLAVPAMIHQNQKLREWVLSSIDKNHLNDELIPAFKNFVAANGNPNIDLQNLNLNDFLNGQTQDGLLQKTTQLIDRQIRLQWPQPLLSSEHLLLCVQALNRRSREIHAAIIQEDTKHPLLPVAQPITIAERFLGPVAPQIAQQIGYNNRNGKFYWTPPGCENPFAQLIAALTWTVAASARLAAHRKTTPADFNSVLENLTNGPGRDDTRTKINKLLSRLLSLAPELFTFYIALFELRLSSIND